MKTGKDVIIDLQELTQTFRSLRAAVCATTDELEIAAVVGTIMGMIDDYSMDDYKGDNPDAQKMDDLLKEIYGVCEGVI